MLPVILQHPHRLLRERCVEVTHFDTALRDLTIRMEMAMAASPVKALGLAANQIGELKRVIIVVQAEHLVTMVNPVILWTRGVQTIRDGCLSVKHGTYFRSRVRPLELQVEFQDLAGVKCKRRAKGMHAAAIAHEIDHLDGKMFIDELPEAAA